MLLGAMRTHTERGRGVAAAAAAHPDNRQSGEVGDSVLHSVHNLLCCACKHAINVPRRERIQTAVAALLHSARFGAAEPTPRPGTGERARQLGGNCDGDVDVRVCVCVSPGRTRTRGPAALNFARPTGQLRLQQQQRQKQQHQQPVYI